MRIEGFSRGVSNLVECEEEQLCICRYYDALARAIETSSDLANQNISGAAALTDKNPVAEASQHLKRSLLLVLGPCLHVHTLFGLDWRQSHLRLFPIVCVRAHIAVEKDNNLNSDLS